MSSTVAESPRVRLRRIYDEPLPDDGVRVLVDRLWPRGLKKTDAHVDEWCKEIAPSTELRRWYGHDPQRFAAFATRYHDELSGPERAPILERLRAAAATGQLTLLTATRQTEISAATVLAEEIADRRPHAASPGSSP
jgi:uncharacterized protein YeaO (DUF488 family)